jgi:hypothetical protein
MHRVVMHRRTEREDNVNEAAERRVLGLVGLGIRARNAVVGVEQVRMAARKGKLALALVEGPDAAALGSVAGRESTAAIGITDAALARGVRKVFDEDEVR